MGTRYFSYVLVRDHGFAPNPFNSICTLATCKPNIRNSAFVGDWIFGSGSARLKRQNQLIYAMKVTNKISFNKYWTDPHFETKKPVMNGSLKKMYGDNIYYSNGTNWIQADSHHSLKDGSTNDYNLIRDTSVDAVLISDEFYYFGTTPVIIPSNLLDHVIKKGPGHRYVNSEAGEKLLAFISNRYSLGYHGDPTEFNSFKRYDGKS